MVSTAYQPDLFGEVEPPAPKTREQEYQTYIASPQWRRRAEAALVRAGYCCEHCGLSHYSRKLEVHHLTYERLGHERPEDLEVLCHECHQAADAEREEQAAAEAHERHVNGPLAKGFEQWMLRGTRNPRWRARMSTRAIRNAWDDFLDAIEHETGKRYYAECPFRGSEAWY